MYFKQLTGKIGEDFACAYLKKSNYIIIDRNFSCYQGEIDIIAKDTLKNELVFIEVKTRTNFKYGYPVDAVNQSKQKHLLKACQYYLYKKHIDHLFIRLDIIQVFIKYGIPYVHHIKQII